MCSANYLIFRAHVRSAQVRNDPPPRTMCGSRMKRTFFSQASVNSKNNSFSGTAPPEDVLLRPLHSTQCTLWVAISKHGIIGHFWFEDENRNGQYVMENTERYLVVHKKF